MHKTIVQSHEGLPELAATARQPLIRKAALASAVALALLGASLDAQALALGAVSVRSALGEPLRADVEIPQISSEEASTLQASVGTPQAFRAAGMEYSPALAGARVTLQRRANGQAYLRIIGSRPINEPYVGVVIEASWANGRVVRDYTLLLDPPGREALPAVVATQPQAPAPARPAVAEQTTPRPSATPAPRAAPRPERTASAAGGEQITVQRGDTLSRIAGAHAIDGVSLDQMMVALLQANPDAFIRGNVNLIKAGAVLQMPSAEQARATPRQAARRAVVAQSKDFQAYRHAVAKAAPAQPNEAGGGQTASGSVQAQVSDRKAPAPTPDQLKISKGGAPGGAETTAALSRQAQEQADREAELKRNISALKDLTSTASAPATSAPAPAPAAAAASSEAPGVNVPLAAGATAAATAASAATAAAASTTTTETSAAAPAPDASAAATAETAAAAASTPADAASATVAAATAPAPAPTVAAPAPPPAAEPSFLDGLTDNPLLPVAGAGLIALLAGLGIYRARQRKQKDAARDSEFIESRLQPDSFFGGSGGQQVDTKERASGGSSSMAYSPSQLDAAGDVDPVAEADVYLAYGRDMQAEEILKEALLTHPGRISVHRKLAEIYAKRRDARALEALASEAHTLTQGDGPDWQAIASLGAELDPNNPLYKPGGMPVPKVAPASARRQFGADTEPQTAQVILGKDKDEATSTGRPPLDLNLDLGESVRQAAPKHSTPAGLGAAAVTAATGAAVGAVAAAADSVPTSARQALDTPAPVKADSEFVDLDLGMDFAPPSELAATSAPAPALAAAPSAASPKSNSGMIEFDMDALSVDPDSRSGDIKTEQPDDADDNPLSTKLSLAQEFRAIGDIDGARTLASEVVAEATGALKVRAERFLTEL